MLATGNNPMTAYAALVRGAVGVPLAHRAARCSYATPLIFTGLAVAVAFRAGLFNIGGEGQLYIGAITAAWLGVSLGSLGPFAMVLVLAACACRGFSLGRHTRLPQGILRGARGDHHDHAELRRDLPGLLPRAPTLQDQRGPSPARTTIDFAARIPFIGAALGQGELRLLLRAPRSGGRLLAPVAHAPRVRDTGGRPLARRGELRRHAARAEHGPGARHRRLRWPSRRRGGGPRGLRQHGRALGRQPRLQRHRGRAPRAQPPRRGGAWRPALRRPHARAPRRCSSPPTCRCSSPTCCSP